MLIIVFHVGIYKCVNMDIVSKTIFTNLMQFIAAVEVIYLRENCLTLENN